MLVCLEIKHLEEIAMQTKLPIDTLMEQLLCWNCMV